MRRENKTPFTSALVVSANRDHLRLDRDTLRKAGVERVHGGTDVKKALAWLAKNPVDVVLLDADLGSVRGADAAAVLRKRRGLDRTPIVLTSLSGSEADVLDALAAGCTGYLVRPYSMESFLTQMRRAARGANPGAARKAALARARRQARAGDVEHARQSYGAVAEQRNEALARYEAGCEHLAGRRFDEALREFGKAVAINSLYAEAYVGLASCHKALGEPERARDAMRKAAQAFALREEMRRTRRAVVQVLRERPGIDNPFLELGFTLVRQGDFAGAGRAYDLAGRYASRSEVDAATARACLFTRDPRRAARLLAAAMAEASGRDDAPAVYKRIMGDFPRRTARAPQAAETAQEPGVMHDLWAVLKYTWKAYRKGEPIRGGAPLALDL